MLARFDSQEQCAEAPSTKYKAQGNQPSFNVPSEMHRILGVDLSAIPGMCAQGVLTFFCEVGPQITRFASSKHFASWLGLCPDNRISGGKILSSKTRNVRCRLANALRIAATTLYRSHSALGDYFRRLRARLGSPPTITAAAHKLARILFAMLRDVVALSTLNSWGSSIKNIFAGVKTPCANTPLLSALNSFLSKTLLIQFLRRQTISPRPFGNFLRHLL